MTIKDNIYDFFAKLMTFFRRDNEIHSKGTNAFKKTTQMDELQLYEAFAIGDANIIENVVKNLRNTKSLFWASVPDDEMPICKRHADLAKRIINTLVDIIRENYNGIDFKEDCEVKEIWEEIEKDNNFNDQVYSCVKKMIIYGEGWFKFSYIPDVSKYPIIEFIPLKYINTEYKYGRLQSVDFLTPGLTDGRREYILKEIYKKGKIEYELLGIDGKKYNLSTLPETANLTTYDFSDTNFGDKILAIPMKFTNSEQYENCGESILAGKIDLLDQLDEALSIYAMSVRLSMPKEYRPDTDFKVNVSTGQRDINSSIFNPFYVYHVTDPTNSDNKTQLIQSALNSSEYIDTIAELTTLICAGIVSLTTIGIVTNSQSLIDSSSAEDTREKEKQTLYTINIIKKSLEKAIKDVVILSTSIYAYTSGKYSNLEIDEDNIIIDISEYANPSKETILSSLAEAKYAKLVDNEDIVEELHPELEGAEKEAKIQSLNELDGLTEALKKIQKNQTEVEDEEDEEDENKKKK